MFSENDSHESVEEKSALDMAQAPVTAGSNFARSPDGQGGLSPAGTGRKLLLN